MAKEAFDAKKEIDSINRRMQRDFRSLKLLYSDAMEKILHLERTKPDYYAEMKKSIDHVKEMQYNLAKQINKIVEDDPLQHHLSNIYSRIERLERLERQGNKSMSTPKSANTTGPPPPIQSHPYAIKRARVDSAASDVSDIGAILT